MTLPRLAASGAMSVRTQSAIADAMAQRRIAAGFTATRRLSGSTTASSRTRSSPPQPPATMDVGNAGGDRDRLGQRQPAGRGRRRERGAARLFGRLVARDGRLLCRPQAARARWPGLRRDGASATAPSRRRRATPARLWPDCSPNRPLHGAGRASRRGRQDRMAHNTSNSAAAAVTIAALRRRTRPFAALLSPR